MANHFSARLRRPAEACGSTETALMHTRWRISFLLLHFLGIPFPFDIKNRKCIGCGVQWLER
jgi:hypothetical protein